MGYFDASLGVALSLESIALSACVDDVLRPSRVARVHIRYSCRRSAAMQQTERGLRCIVYRYAIHQP